MNKIYLVEYVDRFGVSLQGVQVEDAVTVGYFSGKKAVDNAIRRCVRANVPADNIMVREYPLGYNGNQKYVYVLMYEFYFGSGDNKAEYYYIFPPKTTDADCNLLRERLSILPEYSKTTGKHYYDSSDGFRIVRYDINHFEQFELFE